MNTFRMSQLFRRRLLRLRKRRQRLAFRFRPKEDPRNNAARTLDLLVLAAVFWLGTLVFLAQFWPPGLALPVSLAVAAAGGITAGRFQKKREQLRRQRCRLWLAGQRCREEIKKLTTREEVAIFTSLLLAGLTQFTELRVNQGGKGKAPSIVRAAALCARYKGVSVAVQCLSPASPEQEEVKLLEAFGQFLEQQEMRSALIVAPGTLSPGARRVIAGLRKKYRVVTLNEEKLVELALQAGRQPEPESGREGAGGKEAAAGFKQILGQKKGISYLLAAGVLWLIQAISSPTGFRGGIYLALIAVNLVLALICYVVNRPDDDFDLEDLEPETAK
ncbi:MAG: hypothetical protein K6U04_11250 [Armatimonadetes bacterium]|nr:hypothetical protein [Armatimonadota bacterium]